ncbi:MAG: hypothetical protein M1833_004220 [Piccolia ochrophora]|nr:MAG: hypothetical protein M1833_004220 [Piccolia ochrophora]
MEGQKRKADTEESRSAKKPRGGNKWHAPRPQDSHDQARREIQPGDAGIWATCERGKEGKCVGELTDVFHEYLAKDSGRVEDASEDPDRSNSTADIEADIQREVSDIKQPGAERPFNSVRLDVQCVLFFRFRPPCEPVSLVHEICEDAFNSAGRKRNRFVKRLTPMTLMGRATESDLRNVAERVLAPHFHGEEVAVKKFAIRPTIRNHSTLTRDIVINTVASVVGPRHHVDLKGYNLLILVEVYKNICGVSVVGNDFEKLKRYNLAELYNPAGLPATAFPTQGSETGEAHGEQVQADIVPGEQVQAEVESLKAS